MKHLFGNGGLPDLLRNMPPPRPGVTGKLVATETEGHVTRMVESAENCVVHMVAFRESSEPSEPGDWWESDPAKAHPPMRNFLIAEFHGSPHAVTISHTRDAGWWQAPAKNGREVTALLHKDGQWYRDGKPIDPPPLSDLRWIGDAS